MDKCDFIKHVRVMDYEASTYLASIDMPNMKDVDHPAEYLFNAFEWRKNKPSKLYWKSIWEKLERYY